VKAGAQAKVYAIADEDLERENEEKTAAAHFLRFELTPAMVAALKADASLAMGVDHPAYNVSVGEVDPVSVRALASDLV
jgi:glycerol-3-phosphate dehydrogenase subunit C